MSAMSRAVREYLAGFDVSAIYATRDGRVGAGRNPPPDAAIWWCASGEVGRLVKQARKNGGCDVQAAAHELKILVTPHDVVLTRCAAAAKRIEAGLSWANRTGVLQEVNREYARRRREAERRGDRFMSYSEVMSRLRMAFSQVAAGGKVTMSTLVQEVFGAKG